MLALWDEQLKVASELSLSDPIGGGVQEISPRVVEFLVEVEKGDMTEFCEEPMNPG